MQGLTVSADIIAHKTENIVKIEILVAYNE